MGLHPPEHSPQAGVGPLGQSPILPIPRGEWLIPFVGGWDVTPPPIILISVCLSLPANLSGNFIPT